MESVSELNDSPSNGLSSSVKVERIDLYDLSNKFITSRLPVQKEDISTDDSIETSGLQWNNGIGTLPGSDLKVNAAFASISRWILKYQLNNILLLCRVKYSDHFQIPT